MKKSTCRVVVISIAFVLVMIVLVCCCACDLLKTPHIIRWVDYDGTLIESTTVFDEDGSAYRELPNNTNKWVYDKWVKSTKNNEDTYTAVRSVNQDYFIGNVFQIVAEGLGEQPIRTGSGFVFSSDGWFITNAHVMEDAYYAQAIFNIPNATARESFTRFDINKGSYYQLDKDIYIGKIDNYYTISSYFQNILLNLDYDIGDTTYSVGYPHSSAELVINEGKVIERWSNIYEKLYSGNSYICSSSFIAPGSSGGILVNDNLEVVGITTLGWTNDDDSFLCGAAISAYNFSNLMRNVNKNNLISLQERFHKEDKAFIGFFNAAKARAANGLTEKQISKDGMATYKYKWNDEGINDSNESYTQDSSLYVREDGFMTYISDVYWEDGGRRSVIFYGYYDNKIKLDGFEYSMRYDFPNGKYYTVSSSNVNYSANIALTLNKYEIDSSRSFTPSNQNITYAKEQFNSIYEWLSDWIEEYQ